MSGNDIVTNYSSDKPYKVYGYDQWWGDGWDPLEYGRDFDFDRPFFEQFDELLHDVPRLFLYNPFSENSQYTNHSYHNKNCYLTFDSAYNEDTLYSTNLIVKLKDSMDCMTAEEGEFLYWNIYTKKNYNCKFVVHCSGCMDSDFLYDCKGCSSCFMCHGLRNKQYYINNTKYSQSEYEEKMKEYNLGSYKKLEKLKGDFMKMVKGDAIHKNLHIDNSENCMGDYIFNSKNVRWSFYADNCEDIAYCFDALGNKDCMDTYESSIDCELQYDCYACNESSMMRFCVLCHFSHGLEYCDYCFHCKDCFGCTGLKKKQYCIFNKQYTKEEYEELRGRIVAKMKESGEYGEFFPVAISPFGYNETMAQEFSPLAKEVALEKGYKWQDKDKKSYLPANYNLADDVKDESEDVMGAVLACGSCGKNYKFMPKEWALYKRWGLAVPRQCFDCRHEDRVLGFRNVRALWNKSCGKCGKDFLTSYGGDEVKKLYCEECYLKEVY